MELDPALEAFQSANQIERAKFLKGLFRLLRPSEYYSLHQELLQNNFCFDILGHLPLEIAIQIAEYLDPRDVVRLHQVSRRWASILSSKTLSRALIGKFYSLRTDLPDYKQDIDGDAAFSALRNLAFREYAGRTGLYRLRERVPLNPALTDGSEIRSVEFSRDLKYVIIITFKEEWHCLEYIVRLDDRSPERIIPLLTSQREAFEYVHAGTACIVACTLNSGRGVIWNTAGDLIYEFKMMSTGVIKIGSSETYVVLRNSNQSPSADYYLFDISRKTLSVYSDVLDSVEECKVDNPIISVIDSKNQIIITRMFGAIYVLRLGFGSNETRLTQEGLQKIDLGGSDGPYLYGNIQVDANVITFERFGKTGDSIVLINFDKDGDIFKVKEIGALEYSTNASFDLSTYTKLKFYHRDTLYRLVKLPLEQSYHDTITSSYYGVWCYHGPTKLLKLLSLPGQDTQREFESERVAVGVNDKEFVICFTKNLFVYEWLDFDQYQTQNPDTTSKVLEA